MQFDQSFLQDIKTIWQVACAKAYTLVNRASIDAYWDMGRRIERRRCALCTTNPPPFFSCLKIKCHRR